jgi:two-component system response regulator HydG
VTVRILIVDDDRSMCELLGADLGRRGHQVTWRLSATDGLAALATADVDVVVTDVRMARVDGIALCERAVTMRPDVPVIVMTAFGSMDTAIAAMRAGAYDFVVKPFELDHLARAIERAAAHRTRREEVKRLGQVAPEASGFDGMIGDSPAMAAVRELIERIAGSEATVLITGESGTGKEVVARALHRRSPRAAGPFVAINCAAVPATLLESELFGHARGAFTDARQARAGLFEQANHGTLLLDEIGDLPLGLQPKLLRVLEERAVRPLGATATVPIDVRLICATHHDLREEIAAGRFRDDLFFRIDVIHVELPPLRAREGDVLLLAQHFLDQFVAQTTKPIRGFATEAAERLLAYPWPGNVRELRNCVERAVALARFDRIVPDDLPPRVRDHEAIADAGAATGLATMAEVERRHVLRVLEAAGGSKAAAARILGVDRATLYRKLERYARQP